MEIKDMPKIESPFVRKIIDGFYIVTPEINKDYKWVFEDENVMAIEKLNGTNVSIVIEEGNITSIWNRTNRIPFFNKGKSWIVQGILESYDKGYCNFTDGQYFGELIGPKVQGNPYKLDKHLWIPFTSYGQNHLKYKSWGQYPKDFDTISTWFKEDLFSLFARRHSPTHEKVSPEGIVFTHPDGRMAKLRCDMFDWFKGNSPHRNKAKK